MPDPQAATEPTGYPPPAFEHRAYGVQLTWFGEDGGMAAAGHVPDLRFIAACNHLARKDAGMRNIWDDPAPDLETTLAAVSRVWAVPIDPGGEFDWAVNYHSGITGQTPGAIPLTVLLP